MNIIKYAVLSVFLTVLMANQCFTEPLARLYIRPGSIGLMPGAQQKMTVIGTDKFGVQVPVSEPITWSASPAAGTISADGVFTAGNVSGRYLGAVKVKTASGITGVANVDVIQIAPSGRFIVERAVNGVNPGALVSPKTISLDPSGNLWVLDTGVNVIQVLDPSCNYLTHWGRYGDNSHISLSSPRVATMGPNGFLYVSVYRSGNYWSLEKYSRDGDHQFTLQYDPKDMQADSAGNLFMLIGNEVIKLNGSGSVVTRWGSEGSNTGQFKNPQGLGLDKNGNVYVADTDNNRIQKFTNAGAFVRQWSSGNPSNLNIAAPSDVAVASDGSMCASSYGVIHHFEPNGNYLGACSSSPATDISSIVAGNNGSIYAIARSWENGYYRGYLYRFDAQSQCLGKWGAVSFSVNSPFGIAASPNGEVLVTDEYLDEVERYDSSFNYLGKINGKAKQVATDKDGNVYTNTTSGIRKFSPTGTLLNEWSATVPNFGGLAVDGDGNIFNIGPGGNDVEGPGGVGVAVFGPDGTLLRQWGTQPQGYARVDGATGIALDSQGDVYITENINGRLKKFDKYGRFLGMWSSSGTGFSQLGLPWGLTVTRNNQVVIADGYNGRLSIYSTTGQYIATFGSEGYEYGQFMWPRGVTEDAEGNLYVTDSQNHRLQKLIPNVATTGKFKNMADGKFVVCGGGSLAVTGGSLEFGDCFYVQNDDFTNGVKVVGATAQRNSRVNIIGHMGTIDGERVIRAATVYPAGTTNTFPFGMNLATVGGGRAGLQQPCWGMRTVKEGDLFSRKWVELSGLNNVGLLIKSWGKVLSVDEQAHTFVIDDGSGANVLCKLPAAITLPAQNSVVTVTGVSSTKIDDQGRLVPMIRLRIAGDLTVIKP